MKTILFAFIFFTIVGCQKPAVSIQTPKEDQTDSEDKNKQALIDEYIQQIEEQQNIDDSSIEPKETTPQEYLESLTRESRQALEEQNNNSNIVKLIDNPLHSRFNSSTYAKSLGSRFLSLQQETSKSQKYLNHQSYNDHILTQLLQGISFSSKAVTPNEAIETYKHFFAMNLFINYDEPFWRFYRSNDPLRNIEFFESAAILTKTSLLSGYLPHEIYEKFYILIKSAYNSYFDLDDEYSINDYLNMAYLTEEFVFYTEQKNMSSKTAGDFISLIDNYNCQINEDYIDDLYDKLLCFKSQNYIEASISLTASLNMPNEDSTNLIQALDFNSTTVSDVLSKLENQDLWSASLTNSSKLKLAGLLVGSNVYQKDAGQSVIESFNSIYKDLMHSDVIDTKIRLLKTEPNTNVRFELKFPIDKSTYTKKMFDIDVQEHVQAIAIELTKTSMGLY